MDNSREIARPKDVIPAHNNLHVDEMHVPSNFRWPLSAGTGEKFVPNLTLHDKGQPLDGKSQGKGVGHQRDSGAPHAHSEPARAHTPDKGAAWTVHKGETLYGKAEHELHSHGKPDAHYSAKDVRKEVVTNAERNHWVKSAEAAHSPEEQHRRSQFEAYVKDGKTSHLPKDLNGMVHKSLPDKESPAVHPDDKTLQKPTKEQREGKEAKEAKEAKELKDAKDAKDAKELKDGKEQKSTPELRAGAKPETTPPGTQPPRKVNDLNGKVCKVQPTGEQIPTLEQNDKGCQYRDPSDPAHPENKELADLVKRGKESTVEIAVRMGSHEGAGGSGVIIGHSKDGSKVYVATDNHVASPEVNPGGHPAQERRVRMPDGKGYPAQLALKEPGTDRAVLAVDVGAGNADKFKAAEFGDNPAQKDKGVILGFPKDSDSMYATPANLDGVAPSENPRTLRGEKRGRPLIEMPRTHSEEGVSGAPIFNHSGQVVGLLEGGQDRNPTTGRREYWAYGTPTTKAEVNNWLAQIQANEEKRK